MIDLHSHILPGIDDGAPDAATAVAMARIAVAHGTHTLACTPHIHPGRYDNSGADIARRVDRLRAILAREGVPLELVAGADVHVAPDLVHTLGSDVPTLGGSRYFLYEPPHQLLPPNLVDHASRLVAAGFVPILTHPERLSWVNRHYDTFEALNEAGCLVQVTANALTGGFGQRAETLALRMLDEGRIDIIASDAHDTTRRPPVLSRARELVAGRLGAEAARLMVEERPRAILADEPLEPAGLGRPRTGGSGREGVRSGRNRAPGLLRRLFNPRG